MSGVTVDADLEKFLRSNIPSGKTGTTPIVEDDDLEVDEEEENKSEPCNESQRKIIWSHLKRQGLIPDDPARLIALIRSIKTMTKVQADDYIEGLDNIKTYTFSTSLCKRIMNRVNDLFLNDEKTKVGVLNDEALMSDLYFHIANIFGKMGAYKGAVIYGFYIFDSFLITREKVKSYHGIPNSNTSEKSETQQTSDNDGASI